MPEPDYLARSVGSFDADRLGGLPADTVKSLVLDRAGVPYRTETGDVHPLRAGLVYTHGSYLGACPRVPSPFPPAGYAGPLSTAADWLNAVDTTSTAGLATKAVPGVDGAPIIPPPIIPPAVGRSLTPVEVTNTLVTKTLVTDDAEKPAEAPE